MGVLLETRSFKLDASSRSTLQWKQEIACAEKERGSLFWELDFGSEFLVEDEMIFASHELAIHHFVDHVWSLFRDKSVGVLIYEGKLEQVLEEHRFYFKQLASCFPFEIPLYVRLDASRIQNRAIFFRLSNRELFQPFHLLLHGGYADYYQEEGSQVLLLPQLAEGWDFFDRALDQIKKPFKVLSEALLIDEWAGADLLYVIQEGVSPSGWRKIKGFEAAGGIVEYV